MQKKLRLIPIFTCLACLLATTLSGCTYLRFPGVYRIAVQQGNIIDQKKVDQLKVGMTKRQVQFVMGSPLVSDLFTPDRWDYVYQLRRGEDTLRQRRFTLLFKDDMLVSFEGDYEPNSDKEVDDDYIEDSKKTEG